MTEQNKERSKQSYQANHWNCSYWCATL